MLVVNTRAQSSYDEKSEQDKTGPVDLFLFNFRGPVFVPRQVLVKVADDVVGMDADQGLTASTIH